MDESTTLPKPREAVDEWLGKSDNFAQREPAKAAMSAFGIGMVLSFLPIGPIVGVLTSAALVMARPILLFLGVMKACDLLRAKNQSPS
jgi:hypothetical protein